MAGYYYPFYSSTALLERTGLLREGLNVKKGEGDSISEGLFHQRYGFVRRAELGSEKRDGTRVVGLVESGRAE